VSIYIEMLRTITLSTLLFACMMLMPSCVDRIGIPEEGESKLVLVSELQYLSNEITATLSASGNLNGSQEAFSPHDADITISRDKVDGIYRLVYDESRKLYATTQTLNDEFWLKGNTYNIECSVPDDRYKSVTASVTKLRSNTIVHTKTKPAYYHLHLNSKLTVLETNLGTPEYVSSGNTLPIDIESIESGGAGVIILHHRDGILIDHSRLEENTIEITIVSPHEVIHDNQVLDMFDFSLNSVSKDYYDYHKAYSNRVQAVNGQYVDPPIFSNNIKNGVGLFSIRTGNAGTSEIE